MTKPSVTPKPAKPYMRVSGGNPAGMEDFVPLNPWGRSMPRFVAPKRPELYQLIVRDAARGNKETRVGPKIGYEWAMMFCKTVEQMIASGAEKRWRDPIVLKMS